MATRLRFQEGAIAAAIEAGRQNAQQEATEMA
jgi:hypothetical protein